MASKRNFSEGVRREALAPVASPKIKKRPRGKSFERGNNFGAATRWKPGVSGNPSGRTSIEQKADAELSKALLQRLPEVDPSDRVGRTYCQKLADVLIQSGLEGNVGAIVAIGERIEGKPATAVQINSGPDPLDLLLLGMKESWEREFGGQTAKPALEGEVSNELQEATESD